MEFKTLENTAIDEILAVFNLSFLNSVAPFQLTKDEFEHKITNDSIQLECSAGAFIDHKLVGFILHGIDNTNPEIVAYNAGTGVDPNFRGNKIISKLYDDIIPILKNIGVNKMQLEVITENVKALPIYKSIGFKIDRELKCYKGIIPPKGIKNYEIRELKEYDWSLLEPFWDVKPSWQNAINAVQYSFNNNNSIGIYENDLLLGYLIYNPIFNKIQQLAIDKKHRKKGLARQLLESIPPDSELILNNIDASSDDINTCLLQLGLKLRIKQYEMSLEI